MREIVLLALRDAAERGVKLELVAKDDRADEALAATVAEELADDPSVVAVIGHKNSGPSGAAAPIYHQARLCQITQSSTDSSLTSHGWDTLLRLCADNQRQGRLAAESAREEFGVRTAVVVHDSTAYGQPLAEAFAGRFTEIGGTVLERIPITVGQQHFDHELRRLLPLEADLVYLGTTEIEGSKLAAAMRDRLIGSLIMSAEGGPGSPFAKLAGAAAEGSLHTYAGTNPGSTETTRAATKRFHSLLGAAPSYALECYDAARLVTDAIAAGAGTREEVLAALRNSDHQGLTGRIAFLATGERQAAPVSLWRIKNGESVPYQRRSAR